MTKATHIDAHGAFISEMEATARHFRTSFRCLKAPSSKTLLPAVTTSCLVRASSFLLLGTALATRVKVTDASGFGRSASLSKTDIEQLYRAMIVAEARCARRGGAYHVRHVTPVQVLQEEFVQNFQGFSNNYPVLGKYASHTSHTLFGFVAQY